MSKKEKLFLKLRASPNNCHFEDICLLAEHVGFLPKGNSGTSHRIYKHNVISGPNLEGVMNFQNVNGKAKPFQVRQLLDFIEKHGLLKEE